MERLTEKAIGCFKYRLKNKADSKVGAFNDYDAFYNHMLAVKRLGELEDQEEKYRWHDLRKNPEDLPHDMENVQICWMGGSNNWYDSMFWNADRKVFSINGNTEYEVIHPVIGDERHSAYGQAIAWRYIEPFKEVEGTA